MNERFRELEKQSYKEIIETNDYNGSAYTVREFDSEKFAELIVKDCMLMCRTSAGNADYNTGRLHCLENIMERFGVEYD